MTDITQTNEGEDQDKDPVSGWQVFFDDPGMLTFLGIASPAIFYLMWGVMEILTVPLAGY
ncbi:MAG: hypothetical protein GXP08_07095 [Gammaproteobacteria bacterium]|nr:hypothetical protein [Gammaproteobacteria bacterium]